MRIAWVLPDGERTRKRNSTNENKKKKKKDVASQVQAPVTPLRRGPIRDITNEEWSMIEQVKESKYDMIITVGL